MISKYLDKFPREFIGHGLGPHEQPRMNHVSTTVLEAPAVICIEYSYYHDGVRHHTEDTFLVIRRGELDRELPARPDRSCIGSGDCHASYRRRSR